MQLKKLSAKILLTLGIILSVGFNCVCVAESEFTRENVYIWKASGTEQIHYPVNEFSKFGSVTFKRKPKALLSKEKLAGIKLLAEKLALPFEEIKSKLQINENCYLVPLLNLVEHKTCLVDIFSKANPKYMRYYLDGKLKSHETVEKIYFTNSLHRMWDNNLPRSLNFIIDCGNTSIGRIAVGPLYNRGAINAEVGYALMESHSGREITSGAVKTLLNFLQYLLAHNIYNFEKIRATAKADNIASNKILMKNNFVKSPTMINDGYGPENEYFYYFDKKL